MRRRVIGLVAASAFAVATMGGSAAAAELKANQLGATCPAGYWLVVSFLNVQVPKDAGAGSFTVRFEGGGTFTELGAPIEDNGKKVRRFGTSAAFGGSSIELTSATTTLPGKVVLASAECVPF